MVMDLNYGNATLEVCNSSQNIAVSGKVVGKNSKVHEATPKVRLSSLFFRTLASQAHLSANDSNCRRPMFRSENIKLEFDSDGKVKRLVWRAFLCCDNLSRNDLYATKYM